MCRNPGVLTYDWTKNGGQVTAVATRLHVSSFEKAGCERVPGLFFFKVDRSSLRSSPGIRRSFWSLKRNDIFTSKLNPMSFSILSMAVRSSFAVKVPSFILELIWSFTSFEEVFIWIPDSGTTSSSESTQPLDAISFLIISNQNGS